MKYFFLLLCFSNITFLSAVQSSEFIVNGDNSTIEDNPWQVLILGNLGSSRSSMCSGSIINKRVILTAAHCVCGRYSSFLFGGMTKVYISPGTQLPVVKKCIKFKSSNPNQLHDIQLIITQDDIVFNDKVKPISLPESKKDYDELILEKERPFFHTGWGKDDIDGEIRIPGDGLKVTKPLYVLPALSLKSFWEESNKTKYFGISTTSEYYHKNFHQGARAFFDKVTLSSGCFGDSGGPLVTFKDNKPILMGVVSSGHDRCRGASLFYMTGHYLGWIKRVLEKFTK